MQNVETESNCVSFPKFPKKSNLCGIMWNYVGYAVRISPLQKLSPKQTTFYSRPSILDLDLAYAPSFHPCDILTPEGTAA